MDDPTRRHNHRHPPPRTLTKINSTTTATAVPGDFCSNGSNEQEDEVSGAGFAEELGDTEVWSSFTDNFLQVQSVLDRNRVLIQQVNENHQSKIHENLVQNVALIQEINGNISKIVSLYSDLSTNFSTVFHQRNAAVDANSGNAEKDSSPQA
nr:early flowering 4-like 8 [Diospyros sp. 'deyangshi']